jgi:hypothetical protein
MRNFRDLLIDLSISSHVMLAGNASWCTIMSYFIPGIIAARSSRDGVCNALFGFVFHFFAYTFRILQFFENALGFILLIHQ